MPIIVTDPSSLYVTADEVRKVLAPDGAEDQSTAAQMTDAALEEAIGTAQAEVDARLRDRYTVPFDPAEPPRLVAEITRDIAAYLATLTHRRAGDVDENETVRLRYTRAKELLELASSGEIELGIGSDDLEVTLEPTVVNPRDYDLFNDAAELGRVDTYLP